MEYSLQLWIAYRSMVIGIEMLKLRYSSDNPYHASVYYRHQTMCLLKQEVLVQKAAGQAKMSFICQSAAHETRARN